MRRCIYLIAELKPVDHETSIYIFLIPPLYTYHHRPRAAGKTITVDGLEREYLLYVPAAYDGSEEWPLVLNLHPILGDGNKQMVLTNMNAVADTAHFLVAYPNGTPIGPGPTVLNWNVSLSPDGPDDALFLSEVIDTLSEAYNVDPCRIFSAGYDTGGMMSYRLACLMPGRFAAVASIGGIAPIEFEYSACTPGTPFPLLHMHGTADPFIPFNGGTDGAGNTSPPTREVIGNWLFNNDCVPDSTVVEFEDVVPDDNTTVSKIEYTNCAAYIGPDEMEREAEVWFYIVENGGHSWPGAPAALYPANIPPLGNINLDIDASVEIWNFFSRHLNTGDPSCATIVSTETVPPVAFNLRAYPNPASTQLTFAFELPEAARVQLTLYNPLGQPVQQLADENLPADRQRIGWERPASVAAGLYYYRLQFGGRFVARPVVLR
ncbi:MAG: T9SS type A sorting domain-containing protein [Phaeodactylibacter sp.]|nr:T9SS type A sorting domain-containing protein [Phaeodactylibacter sp.]